MPQSLFTRVLTAPFTLAMTAWGFSRVLSPYATRALSAGR